MQNGVPAQASWKALGQGAPQRYYNYTGRLNLPGLVVFRRAGHSVNIISDPAIHTDFTNRYDEIWDQRFGEFSYLEYAWEMKHLSEDFGTRLLDNLCDPTDRYLVRTATE